MEKKLSSAAKSFSPSPIQQLSLLAQRCNAINLAEGFPDFPAPLHIKNAAVSAINSDFNQYRLPFNFTLLAPFFNWNYWIVWIYLKLAEVWLIQPSCWNVRHVQGICEQLAKIVKQMHGLDVDPLSDIAICCGQTEAFAAAVFAGMCFILFLFLFIMVVN